jgi:hypothetical protein
MAAPLRFTIVVLVGILVALIVVLFSCSSGVSQSPLSVAREKRTRRHTRSDDDDVQTTKKFSSRHIASTSPARLEPTHSGRPVKKMLFLIAVGKPTLDYDIIPWLTPTLYSMDRAVGKTKFCHKEGNACELLVIVWSINYEQVVSSIRKMGLKLRVSYLKHNLKSTLAMGMIYLRYYFHEWSRINEFDVVLYTDCDVILNAPLDPIIPKIGVDKIYAVPEGVHHEYFWSLATIFQ